MAYPEELSLGATIQSFHAPLFWPASIWIFETSRNCCIPYPYLLLRLSVGRVNVTFVLVDTADVLLVLGDELGSEQLKGIHIQGHFNKSQS